MNIAAITLDCTDVAKVAGFWSAALGQPLDEGGNQFFASIGRETHGPARFFMAVPEAKAVKNRMHLDYRVENRTTEIERLVGLGATRLSDHDEWGMTWTTMADPEGNEFCISDQSH